MVHRVRIEALKLIWREQDTPLVALNLSEEVLLLIIMSWSHIACTKKEADMLTYTFKARAKEQVRLCWGNKQTALHVYRII